MRRHKAGARHAATPTPFRALFCCLVVLCAAAGADAQQRPTLVSVNSAGTGTANRRSDGPYRTSADGRYVVFSSDATDLAAPDNGPGQSPDLFVRDTVTNTTTLVSINAAGTAPANGITRFGIISADGRYVAFTSFASDVVTNDTNSAPDVFIRDLQTNTTRLVSVNAAGTASGMLGISELSDMSPDGRYVVFTSSARDLTPIPRGDDFSDDIYVRDTVLNTTTLVSVNAAGTATGNAFSFGGNISADGRYVAFTSHSSDLVANDTDRRDVFLRDLQAGTTIRLSTNAAGTAGGNNESSSAVVDRSGRIVVFQTRATDLSTLPDNNNLADIFVHDIQTGVRRLITVNGAGTATGSGFPPNSGLFDHGVGYSLSHDGRFVAFTSQAGDLVPNDTNRNVGDVFLYDVTTQARSLVSANLLGTTGTNPSSTSPSISADGRFVAFDSISKDLSDTPDAANSFINDVFVRDIAAGKTHLASINQAGTAGGNSFSGGPVISADGRRVVFMSQATTLTPNDFNNFGEDVFAFDIPPAPQFRLGAAQLSVSESGGSLQITITRDGDATGSASVQYATVDGTAVDEKDYAGVAGRVRFAPGEVSKTLDIIVTDDRFDDDNESFQFVLSDARRAVFGTPTATTVTINDNDASSGPSPVKDATIDAEFFVRQHYADFLNRAPDADGLAHWVGQTTNCGAADPLVCRVNVSAAFFLSIENQETGYLVHRAHKAAFGDLPGKPVPLTLREYLAGSRRVGDGVQVGVGDWQGRLEANKTAFFDEFASEVRFNTIYAGLNNTQYVDALNANTGGALSAAERTALINSLNAGLRTRGQALRAVAEDADFAQGPERNRAFVLAQYFGYLRRDPDAADFRGEPDPLFEGYLFWHGKLNEHQGNFVNAEMVRAFIQSIEYGERFGQ